MQKAHEIVVCGGHLRDLPDGVYSVSIFLSGNLRRSCEKTLYGNATNGKYRYALFRNGSGYIIRRKIRYITEQEQSWQDVATVERIR